MSQKYNNLKGALPKSVGITEDLFKALQDQDLIFEVNLKKALTELEGQLWNPFDREGSARRITSIIKKAVVIGSGTFGPAERIAYFVEKPHNILEKAYGGIEGTEGETRIWGGKTYKKVGKEWKYVGSHSPMANLIDQAQKLGEEAHKSGKSSVPAHDSELMKIIKESSGKVGTSLPLLSAWAKGWHTSNAKTTPKINISDIGYTIKEVGPGGKETVVKHEAGKRAEDMGGPTYDEAKKKATDPETGKLHSDLPPVDKTITLYGGGGSKNIEVVKEDGGYIGRVTETYKGESSKVYPTELAQHYPTFAAAVAAVRKYVDTLKDIGYKENPEFSTIKDKPSVYGPKANLYEKPAFYKEMSGENVFELGGKRWQYVWADYNGKIDIGVYSPDDDLTYGYDWFRETFIDKDSKKKPEDASKEVKESKYNKIENLVRGLGINSNIYLTDKGTTIEVGDISEDNLNKLIKHLSSNGIEMDKNLSSTGRRDYQIVGEIHFAPGIVIKETSTLGGI